MTSEEITKAIEQIGMLAAMQAELVTKANASPAHTVLVLTEIAERCAAIQPGKAFTPNIDDELTKLVAGAIGFCEATSEEVQGIWNSLVYTRKPPVDWRDNYVGMGVTIGYLDDRPVVLALRPIDVAGHRVIFYECTSTVVDYNMVRQFIELLAPETARNANRVFHSDATNFVNILPSGWN